MFEDLEPLAENGQVEQWWVDQINGRRQKAAEASALGPPSSSSSSFKEVRGSVGALVRKQLGV